MKEVLILQESKGKIKSPSDLFKRIKKIKVDYEQENFLLICLNSQNQVIKSKILFKGGLSACMIEPQTLFREALKYNSAHIIIAHNHPSNNLNPSSEDRDIFEKLMKAGEVLNLPILDSIIFNKKEFYSMENEK
jgi:DNA repair protein RadC